MCVVISNNYKDWFWISSLARKGFTTFTSMSFFLSSVWGNKLRLPQRREGRGQTWQAIRGLRHLCNNSRSHLPWAPFFFHAEVSLWNEVACPNRPRVIDLRRMQLSWQQGEAGESLGASAWWDKYREETQQLPTIAIAKKKPNRKKLKKISPYLHYQFHAVIQSSSTYSPPPSLLLVQQIRPQMSTTIPLLWANKKMLTRRWHLWATSREEEDWRRYLLGFHPTVFHYVDE